MRKRQQSDTAKHRVRNSPIKHIFEWILESNKYKTKTTSYLNLNYNIH